MLEPRLPRLVFVVSAALLAACAAPYTVRTVPRGHTQVHVSLGGPLVDSLGPPLPIPAVILGAQYGITDDWNVSGMFHLLAALYETGGLEATVTRGILKQRGRIPELTASLRLTQLFSAEAYRIYPELEAFVSYLFARRWLLYFGLSTLYDFFWEGDHHFRFHWAPTLGLDVRFARRYAVGVAFRWASPQMNTEDLVVDYSSPGEYGIVFVQLAFRVEIQGYEELSR